MATTYEIVYKIAGELSSQFSKTFKIASGSIAKARETMETLAKTASKAEQLVKYRNEAIALNRTLGVQKQSYEQLTSAMAKCQTPQENLIALSKKQKAEIDRTDEALTRKRKAIKELRSELGLHAQSVETLTKRSKLLN